MRFTCGYQRLLEPGKDLDFNVVNNKVELEAFFRRLVVSVEQISDAIKVAQRKTGKTVPKSQKERLHREMYDQDYSINKY
jgi:hypothetical protein